MGFYAVGSRDRRVVARQAARNVEKVFKRLETYPFFKPADLMEFGQYRRMFLDSLSAIEERIVEGKLEPLDLQGFPERVCLTGDSIEVALYIGSFDPFQMTHLATSLRYLASPASIGRVVFVVPEGAWSSSKPNRSDYAYRYDILSRQLRGAFTSLVEPLDIGKDADTIEIVRRFMGFFIGRKVGVTHLVGSDVFPLAMGYMRQDLDAWNRAARQFDVDFTYRIHVVPRSRTEPIAPHLETARQLGVNVTVDTGGEIVAPSSTDFREHGAFTIAFPTPAMLKHLEVLFRYNLHKSWTEP